MTWADIYAAAMIKYVTHIVEFDEIRNNEHINKLIAEVYNKPSIKSWLDKREKPNVTFPSLEEVCSTVS